MKKHVLLTLAAAGLFLAACGEQPAQSSSPTPTPSSESSIVPASSSETPASSSETPASSSSETPSSSSSEAATITGVTVAVDSGYEAVIAPEGNTALTATVTGTGAFSREVTWKSSDTSIATVDQEGVVTGVAVGKATITATAVGDTSKSGTIEIEVNDRIGITALADVIKLATDAEFTTRAIIAGIPSGTFEYTPNGGGEPYDEYRYVYIADGETFLQGFNVRASDLQGLAVGDTVEVKGKMDQHTYDDKTTWVTPEFHSRGFKKVTDSKVTAPVFKTWDAEHALGTITEADINKGYEISKASVTSISTSGKGNTTINVTLGTENAVIYLHADSKDNTGDEFKKIKVGSLISGKTFIGANYNQDGFQFVGLTGLTVEEGEATEGETYTLAEVQDLALNTAFTSYGKVVGIPNKTKTVNSKESYQYIFVADGETFYQLFQPATEYLTGIEVGDIIKFTGVVSNNKYQTYWTTKEAKLSKAVTKITDGSVTVAEPVYRAWDSTHTKGEIVEADVNKGYAFTDATVKTVSGSNITLEIGTEEFAVYLRDDSYDLTKDGYQYLTVGSVVSGKAILGHKNSSPQFIHLYDLTKKEVALESLTISDPTSTIAVGGTKTLTVTPVPGAADGSVTWKSGDTSKVTVSDKGVITGVAVTDEPVTVTATSTVDNTKTAVCQVTVTEAPAGYHYSITTNDHNAASGNNGYADWNSVTDGDVVWSGNANMKPGAKDGNNSWRIGGKKVTDDTTGVTTTNYDRVLSTTSQLEDDIQTVKLDFGAFYECTVNSITVEVYKNYDSTAHTFSTLLASYQKDATAIESECSLTFTKQGTADTKDGYLKMTFNVTVNSTSNRFIRLSVITLNGAAE